LPAALEKKKITFLPPFFRLLKVENIDPDDVNTRRRKNI
jgi:hypothetical protein